MADIALSSRADVKPLPGALCRRFDTGGVVLAGHAVRLDSSGDVQTADAVTFANAKVMGVAVADNDGGTAFASGEAIDVCVSGPLAGFTALAEGTLHYTSANAGSIADASAGSGNYKWIIGMAHAATILFINPFTDDLSQLTS